MRLTPRRASLVAALFLSVLFLSPVALAADHRDSPTIAGDPEADIADFFAFKDPNNPDDLVMIMTVSPFSQSSVATSYAFDRAVLYRFNIDNDGDAIADAVVDVTVRPAPGPGQIVRGVFPGSVVVEGPVTAPTIGIVANPPVVTSDAGMRIFAGPRDDPFYFDAAGFERVVAGTGNFLAGRDGHAGMNVLAIAVALPLDAVTNGATELQLWAETHRTFATVRQLGFRGSIEQQFGAFQRVDRAGNPALVQSLLSDVERDLYNIGDPADDAANFAAPIESALVAIGTEQADIDSLLGILVPDTLKLDLTQAALYPNGRTPEDDVVDTLLSLLFDAPGPTSDLVNFNDAPPEGSFPFLAVPHQP